MEVVLEPRQDVQVPPDTFLSLRIGDVQKQSRLSGLRSYKFPEQASEKQAFARVEIFRRVGHVAFSFNGDSRSVDVPVDLPGLSKLGLSMKINGSGPASLAAPAQEVEKSIKTKARMEAVAQYMAEFSLEERLADVMREVITLKPENPFDFLSKRIAAMGAEMSPKIVAKVPLLPIGQPPLVGTKPVVASPLLPSGHPALVDTKPALALSDGFAAYHVAHFKSVPPDAASWSKLYSKFGVVAKTKTTKSADGPPSRVAFVHMASVGTWISVLRRPVDEPLASAPRSVAPPVDEALASAPPSTASPKLTATGPEQEQMPFELRPSVGTWLGTPSPKVRACLPACAAANSGLAHLPFEMRPSVGTWLTLKPEMEEEPPLMERTVSDLMHWQKETLITSLRHEVELRDTKILELTQQLAALTGHGV